jgi:cytochrome oxidase Cu insertion factor (SCO1/SenC/PrrC family)
MKARRACALVVAASLIGASAAIAEQEPSAAEMMDDLMDGRGVIGGPFTLTDQRGTRRSDSEFRGKLMIIYFGYTFCPDVCPTDLMMITRALDALGSDAEAVQPTSSPSIPSATQRSSFEYVKAFHPSLIALTGSTEEIRQVANSYKAYYRRVEDERRGEPTIDHSGVIYLMGRNGE